jgi:hypothetical protein
MKFLFDMAKDISHRSRMRRAEAFRTLVIWFAAGAFIGSAIATLLGYSEIVAALIGGSVALGIAVSFKAA